MKQLSACIVAVLLFFSVTPALYAQQGHIYCAPNCEVSNPIPPAKGENRVTCIDRACTTCADKQKNEKIKRAEEEKKRQQALKAAEARRVAEAKKLRAENERLVKEKRAAKANELILVAPGSRSNAKPDLSKATVLSAENKEIIALHSQYYIKATYISSEVDGGAIIKLPQPEFRIYYNNEKLTYTNADFVYLKKMTTVDWTPEMNPVFTNFLPEKGLFITAFTANKTTVGDLVDLDGKRILKDASINEISYLTNGWLMITKQARKDIEYYNYITNEKINLPSNLYSTQLAYPRNTRTFYLTSIDYGASVPYRFVNLYHTWNMDDFNSNGYSFKGTPPAAFEANRHNIKFMFLFVVKNEGDYQLVIYGFDPTKKDLILIDRPANIPSKTGAPTTTLTSYWFGDWQR